MSRRWPFSRPSGAVLGLRVERLNTEFKRLEIKQPLSHQAHRFRFELTQPSQLLITIESKAAKAKGWHRAGYLAHILRGTPVLNPVADVERLYFGPQYLTVPWSGLGYYLEFWPHLWIPDYRVDVWAREAILRQTTFSIENQAGLLLFGTRNDRPEPFTFFGTPIIFP